MCIYVRERVQFYGRDVNKCAKLFACVVRVHASEYMYLYAFLMRGVGGSAFSGADVNSL